VLTAKQSHSDAAGGSNTTGNRAGHAFNRCCPIVTLSSFYENIPNASLRRFNPSLISALTELIPALPSKGHRRCLSTAEWRSHHPATRDRLRLMTFSTVPPTEWVGLRGHRKLEAPERMSDQRCFYSPKGKLRAALELHQSLRASDIVLRLL
jgi:hypothetical protein